MRLPGTARAGAAVLLLAILSACTERAVSSADQSPRRTPQDSITGSQASEPAATPPAADGSIYFAAESSAGQALTDFRSFGLVETHPQQMDIYLTRAGRPVRRVVATRAHERCPAVSPDGTRLAYLAGPTIAIDRLDADGDPGSPEVRVALKSQDLYRPDIYRPRNATGATCPQWSPDGR